MRHSCDLDPVSIYDPNALILTDTYTFDLTYYLGQIIKRKALNQALLAHDSNLNPAPAGVYPAGLYSAGNAW